MRWYHYLSLILAFGSISIAHSQNKLKKEFHGGAPYYELRNSKKGHAYFVIPPGPCSCVTSTQIKCVKSVDDLKAALKEEQDKAKQTPKVECLPNVGCGLGIEIIVGVCHAS